MYVQVDEALRVLEGEKEAVDRSLSASVAKVRSNSATNFFCVHYTRRMRIAYCCVASAARPEESHTVLLHISSVVDAGCNPGKAAENVPRSERSARGASSEQLGV